MHYLSFPNFISQFHLSPVNPKCPGYAGFFPRCLVGATQIALLMLKVADDCFGVKYQTQSSKTVYNIGSNNFANLLWL